MSAALAPLRALGGWWFAPAPAERLAALRIVVGAFAFFYLTTRIGLFLGYARFPARDFVPLGVTRLLDAPLASSAYIAILFVTIVLAALFTTGTLYRITAPLFAIALLFLITYRNSWSMPFHTENLLVLHVVALAISRAADAWSVDSHRSRRPHPANPARPHHDTAVIPPSESRAPAASRVSDAYGWPIRLMAALTALTYVLAGIAKLRLGGMAWAEGEFLRDQVAVDNLRKVLLGADASPFATPLLEHAWLFEVMAIATLLVELGAPLALAGGRIAAIWAVAAWGFHVGVVLLMTIVFPYPLIGIAYAPLFPVDRVITWLVARARRLQARRVQARARS
ncbi:MAG TPA: HTTM domain-containing protein [Kofleriaceae bacterium]|nr:HTTM domain-containing protein [Kofleriaceae bacterium]